MLYFRFRLTEDLRPISPRLSWLALIAGLIMLARLALSVGVFSPTIDESSHIGAAVSLIEAKKLVAPGSHPPLARLVAAIPLWLEGARLPQCRGQTTIGTEDLGYALGTEVLYHSAKPYYTLLIHARLAMLVFPAIALLYVFLLGRMLLGEPAATLAVIFFSVDPTLLGYGFWVGNDLASCAGCLAATYHGLRWLTQPSWGRAAIAGVAVGLAIATKFSCLLVIPVIILLALARTSPWRKLLLQLPLIAAIAFVTLWATYLFNVGPLSDQAGLTAPAHPTSDTIAAQAMRQQWQRVPRWIRETPIPMPSFFLGVARLAAHNRFGHLAYLNGHVSSTGWWYYFPEVFALKTPLGFLAALSIAICLFIFRKDWHQWQTRAILIPCAAFFGAAMAAKLDIGIRYILPAIPFLYLFVAGQLARPGWIKLLAGLILCGAIETAAVHPDYLSYFNVAAGGPSNGDRFALDTNLDWNQDVFRLADWMRANLHDRPYAIRLDGLRNKPLIEKLGLDPASLDASPHGKILFMSKSARLIDGRLSWLARRQPIARIGYSIDVYDLTGPPQPNEPDDIPVRDELEPVIK
jgi:Dolichyl-phosphate-mannose-protein mannosyltransferase